jgi:hypothetical protein
MRKSIICIIGLAALALFATEAEAVKLTQQQVKNTCGSKLQSSNGVDYCVKKCGLNGEHSCDFSCHQGNCQGLCTTCKVKGRTVLPNRYGNRVVRADLALPVRVRFAAGHSPTYCEWCYAGCPPGFGGWLCRLHCQTRGGCQSPVTHP